MIKISAVIITYNEEEHLEKCLRSITGIVDDIIVVDSFSTDRTIEICNAFNVRVVKQSFLGYKEQKNFGNSQAKYDYILSAFTSKGMFFEIRYFYLAKNPVHVITATYG